MKREMVDRRSGRTGGTQARKGSTQEHEPFPNRKDLLHRREPGAAHRGVDGDGPAANGQSTLAFEPPSSVEFRVLGPLDILVAGSRLPVGGRRQRMVLAICLLEAGRIVSVDRLIDEVWDESPPATARAQIQICISSLRRVFARAGLPSDILVTRPPGYQLHIDDSSLDLATFERWVAEGRAAARQHRVDYAVERLRAALGLWRGSILEDIQSPILRAVAVRLQELRLAVLEECFDLELSLGLHDELIAELSAFVVQHPLNERVRGQLMLALYRCGRQAEALQVYREGRRVLSEELGLEPHPTLERMHSSILNLDPSLGFFGPTDRERVEIGDPLLLESHRVPRGV